MGFDGQSRGQDQMRLAATSKGNGTLPILTRANKRRLTNSSTGPEWTKDQV